MKFERNDVRCYVAHLKCLLAMLLAWVLETRWLRGKAGPRPSVIMYGHSLSGNLKAFFDYALKKEDLPYTVYYATIDRREYEKLAGIYDRGILLATRISVMRLILNSMCVMTSHGPGIFYLLKWLRPGTPFVDVWHAVALKAFPLESWAPMRFYSALFVSSEYMKEHVYHRTYKFRREQLVVTGYARVDMFHNADDISRRVRTELNLRNTKYIILFAPTYRPHGECGEIPFGLSASEFFGRLNDFCEKIDATLIFRLHINSKLRTVPIDYSRVRVISQKEYPETNELLTAVDLVVTDWSGVASDFYPLIRPVIYVDTPVPSNHSSEGAGVERVGDHVHNMDELAAAIEKNLKLDKNALRDMLSDVLNGCYGNTLDGCSARRYDMAIRELLHFSRADINGE